jgi:uroporphyrinogen-III synthase
MRTHPVVVLTQEAEDNTVLSELLASHNIETLDYPCIATRYFQTAKNQQIDDLGIADFPLYIFTSRRAVHGVSHLRDMFATVRADFACVGDSTERALVETLGIKCNIKPSSEKTGLNLAREIVAEISLPTSALHIKGNKSTGELKQELEAHGWQVSELVVYENYTPEIIPLDSDRYNAAVFASPSAVGRFFSVNHKLRSDLNCVAIGSTTADYLRKIGARRVFVAEQPDKSELVKAIVSVLNVE